MSKPILKVEEHFLGYPAYLDARQIYTQSIPQLTTQPIDTNLPCSIPYQEKGSDYTDPDAKPNRSRVKWSRKEDESLIKHCSLLNGNWDALTEILPGKTARQIEKRWINKHDPKLRHRQWTQSEDDLILALYNQCGGKWIKIAHHVPGRHSDAIKNRYYSVLRRRSHVYHTAKLPTQMRSQSPPTPAKNENVVNQLKTLVRQYENAITSLNLRIRTLESDNASN